jgi:hypothetical protein
MKGKRNMSLGTIGQTDMFNPESNELMPKRGFINKKETDVDYVELNKEAVKDTKAKQFLNKVFGSGKANSQNNLSSESMATTQKIDMTLPVIQQKKQLYKKTNFLEHWLDEALDPHDLSNNDPK